MSKTNAAIIDETPSIMTFSCQIVSVTSISSNTFQLELEASEDVVLDYTAGHYLQLELDVNKDGKPLSLFYSIANNLNLDSPRRLQLLLQNTSDFVGKVLECLTEKSKRNEAVNVTLPMGYSFLQTDLNLPHLLIAAGSGIAKIKCLTEAILEQNPDADLKVYWSNRSADDFYFLDEFKRLTVQHKNFTFTPILESATTDWSGRSGYIYEVVQKDFESLDGARAYICGSPQMVYGTIDKLALKGLKEENCYSDAFEFAPRG